MTFAFELVTPKSIGMLPRADVGTNVRTVGQGVLELLIGNGSGTLDPVDLDL